MSQENPLWGAPRIHGELLKLGFEVAQSSVAKYMVKRRSPPSQGWGIFLRNHAPDISAMDLFVVPTLGFGLLYALVIIRLDRRELVWVSVTRNPTAEWVARQITEAFPWDEAPRYLIRDQDGVYGATVRRRLMAMGIRDRPIARGSPWQNGYAERLIGSIRRECLEHIVSLVRRTYDEHCWLMSATTIICGHTDHWERIRRNLVQFSGSDALHHEPSLVAFTTNTRAFEFSVQTRGHMVLCGSPLTIVDTLQRWFEEGAADGFNIMPAHFPRAFDEFVDLVVPELQRRRLFRSDYSGATLRDHLGLTRPDPWRRTGQPIAAK